MEIKVWPFLVSRNRHLDYRTVVAPDWLCKENIPNLLSRVADGQLTEPGHAIFRKVHNSKAGDFSVIFRVRTATNQDIGFQSQDTHEILKDSFGRHIYLIEGLVLKEMNPSFISQENLEEAYKQLVEVYQAYSKFWDCNDPPQVISSQDFLVEDGTDQPLKLEELRPFQVKAKSVLSPTKTWCYETRVVAGAAISSIAFSPDGKTLVGRAYNSIIYRWSMSEYVMLKPIDCQEFWLGSSNEWFRNVDSDKSVVFSPDGKFIAFSVIQGADQNNILLWDIEQEQKAKILKGHKSFKPGRIHSVAFSVDSKLLASASQDSTVKLWHPQTGEEYRSFKYDNPVFAIAFSPAGDMIVGGDINGYLEFWDIESGRRNDIRKCGNISSIKSMAFNCDGSFLAVGGQEADNFVDAKYLQILDMKTKNIVRVTGHGDQVNSVAFSPDGQILASGGKDRNIKLWNVKSGEEIVTLPSDDGKFSHKIGITSLAFSPDGKRLASSSTDGTIKFWRCYSNG